MTTITIEEIAVPTRIGEPGAASFIEAIELGNRVEELGYGTPDLAYEPVETISHYGDPNQPTRMFGIRHEGRLVARGLYETTLGEEADTAWLLVQVLPEFEGRGFGRILADHLEQLAREQGKAKTIAYAPMPEVPGERLTSPTGFGSISLGSRLAAFLLQRGYRFEQVERVSRMPLPVPQLMERLQAAHDASGSDYRVHLYQGATPERWLADRAVLATRMSTDAPSAGLEEPEDLYTVERVIETERRDAELNPRRRLTAVAEHVPSGTLVGYTVLSVPPQRSRAVDQYATLVLREHRGHRLGMLLKLANLVHLAVSAPGHPAVITFNAEENRHMLDTNEALGFEPIAYEAAWRKDL